MSRDGRQIAFVGRTATAIQIFVRAVDAPAARPVAGTEGGTLPAWAPDGRRLAFVADAKLKQVSSDGGAPQVIADMSGREASQRGALITRCCFTAIIANPSRPSTCSIARRGPFGDRDEVTVGVDEDQLPAIAAPLEPRIFPCRSPAI